MKLVKINIFYKNKKIKNFYVLNIQMELVVVKFIRIWKLVLNVLKICLFLIILVYKLKLIIFLKIVNIIKILVNVFSVEMVMLLQMKVNNV